MWNCLAGIRECSDEEECSLEIFRKTGRILRAILCPPFGSSADL
jgi:hypothetical protein